MRQLLTDRVTFIFLELPKFNKDLDDLDGNILEGMYFCFKNMAALNGRPKVLKHQIFTKIFEVSELYNMDQDTHDKVLHKMTTERDLRNQIAYARKEAIEEGHAEGRAEERADNIRKMLAAVIPASTIADALGITVEKCESYRYYYSVSGGGQ